MTEEELKEEAKKMGFTITKKPCYQCSCYMPYPNKNYKKANGWKCVDKYEPIKFKCKSLNGPITRCAKKQNAEQRKENNYGNNNK